MTCSKTKRVSKYAAIAWLCLLAIVVIVRAVNLPLGSVQPEAVMLTFMMTLPFTLGLTGLVIGAAWILERRGGLDLLVGCAAHGRLPFVPRQA